MIALAAMGWVRSTAAIRTYLLDERFAYTIRISPDEPTTCVFPGSPTTMEGAGFAMKADDAPAVVLSHQPGTDFFSVRALKENATAALNVVFRGKVYVLSFVSGGEADRVVTFLDEPIVGRQPTKSILSALIERARSDERIAAEHPAMIWTTAHAEPGTVTTYPSYTVTIEKIWRFDPEDTLVFRLRFDNPSDVPVRYDRGGLSVRTGSEIYSAALTDASGSIPPRGATHAYLAITGRPDGGRANLSLRETFSVLVPPAR